MGTSDASVQVFSKKLLHAIWNDYDYGDRFMVRTDCWEDRHAVNPGGWMYVPLRELCRHFDGYACGANVDAPTLTIPPGYFEKQIKIRFGYDDNLPGWVNCNPLKSTFTYKDPNGTDYKWMPKDIPLFWKDRIVEMDIKDFDQELAMQKRREAFIRLMYSYRLQVPAELYILDPTWLEAGVRSFD